MSGSEKTTLNYIQTAVERKQEETNFSDLTGVGSSVILSKLCNVTNHNLEIYLLLLIE